MRSQQTHRISTVCTHWLLVLLDLAGWKWPNSCQSRAGGSEVEGHEMSVMFRKQNVTVTNGWVECIPSPQSSGRRTTHCSVRVCSRDQRRTGCGAGKCRVCAAEGGRQLGLRGLQWESKKSQTHADSERWFYVWGTNSLEEKECGEGRLFFLLFPEGTCSLQLSGTFGDLADCKTEGCKNLLGFFQAFSGHSVVWNNWSFCLHERWTGKI